MSNDMYELTITNAGDASSGVYDSFAQAWHAAQDAAAIDDLTVNTQRHTREREHIIRAECTFCDWEGVEWFDFRIERVRP